MTGPELLTNSPTPGSVVPLVSLAADQPSTSSLSFTMTAAAPAALRSTTSGQFRVEIDSEIIIFDATQVSTTTWTALQRGAEGSTAAGHVAPAGVFHYLTAGGLQGILGFGVTPQPAGTLTSLAYEDNTNNVIANADTEMLYGFCVSRTVTLANLGTTTHSAGSAGALIRLGLRADNGFRLPGALLLDAGTVNGTLGTSQLLLAVAITLTPGIYWYSFTQQGSPASRPTVETGFTTGINVRASGSAASFPLGWGLFPAYNNTPVAGALPANTTSPDIANNAQGIQSTPPSTPTLYLGF